MKFERSDSLSIRSCPYKGVFWYTTLSFTNKMEKNNSQHIKKTCISSKERADGARWNILNKAYRLLGDGSQKKRRDTLNSIYFG